MWLDIKLYEKIAIWAILASISLDYPYEYLSLEANRVTIVRTSRNRYFLSDS